MNKSLTDPSREAYIRLGHALLDWHADEIATPVLLDALGDYISYIVDCKLRAASPTSEQCTHKVSDTVTTEKRGVWRCQKCGLLLDEHDDPTEFVRAPLPTEGSPT
jgi:hypothetical protein